MADNNGELCEELASPTLSGKGKQRKGEKR